MICVFISVFLALTLWVQYICVCSCLPVMRILRASNEGAFREAFNSLLANPEFLGDGGTLTFGLRHVYPIKKSLKYVYGVLKGSDAVVYQSVRTLRFEPALYLYYEAEPWASISKGVIIDEMIDFTTGIYPGDSEIVDIVKTVRKMSCIKRAGSLLTIWKRMKKWIKKCRRRRWSGPHR